MENSKNPGKSILKDNTVPIFSNNRRVSFAPQVTLHQFNLVPYVSENSDNKRRRTMGMVPLHSDSTDDNTSQGELDDGGLAVLQDSSDEDEDVNVGSTNGANLEAHLVPEPPLSDEDEEVDMELTGSQSQKTTLTAYDLSPIALPPRLLAEPNGGEEVTMDLTNFAPLFSGVGNGSAKVFASPDGTLPDSPSKVVTQIQSEPLQDDQEEQTMEFTEVVETITKLPQISETAPEVETSPERTVTESLPQVKLRRNTELEEYEETMEFTQIVTTTTVVENINTIAQANDALRELEEFDYLFQNEVTMELTKVGGNIVKPVLEPIDAEEEEAADADESLDIALAVRDIRSSELRFADTEGEESEEQTMDFTNVPRHIIHTNQESVNEGSNGNVQIEEEEQTMEFTHAVSRVTAVPQSIPQVVVEDVDESQQNGVDEMELTESVGNIIREEKDADKENAENQVHNLASTQVDETPLEHKASPVEPVQEDSNVPGNEYLGSQPMQLTQKDSTRIPINPHNEKVTTSTIPLAEISFDAKKAVLEIIESPEVELEEYEDDNFTPVSLSEFMRDIEVIFYDDLDIDINSVNRLSLTTNTDLGEPLASDYILALPKLDHLALYQFSCEELNKNIIEGKRVFSEFNKTIKTNNPPLFKEYYSANAHEKVQLKGKLQLIKDYTRHQSKITWYDWRSQLTSNLIAELEGKIAELVEDRDDMIADINSLDLTLQKAQQHYVFLKEKLKGIIHFKKEFKTIGDPAKLLQLRDEINTVTKNLQLLHTEVEARKSKLQNLEEQIEESKKQNLQLNKEIKLAERAILNSKTYELNDLNLFISKCKILEQFTGLKFNNLSGKVVDFTFDNLINIKVDFTDARKAENIQFSLDDLKTSGSTFHNKQLLAKYSKLVNETEGIHITESFKKFKALWSVFRILDKDIYKLSIKYPIRFVDDHDNVKFSVRYYNFKSRYSADLIVEVPFSTLGNYPENVSLEVVTDRKSDGVSADLMADLSFVFTSESIVKRITFAS